MTTASAPARSGHQNLIPRRILGPDLIKYLRDTSRHTTGNRYAFDAMRVQRNRWGGPAVEIDVEALEYVGNGHPESYSTLINRIAVNRAERIARNLDGKSEQEQARELDRLLRIGMGQDTTWIFVLSASSLRRLLFPSTFTGTKRSDNVVYLHSPRDYHAGRAVMLFGLSPDRVEKFTTYADKMITNAPVDPAIITPITITTR